MRSVDPDLRGDAPDLDYQLAEPLERCARPRVRIAAVELAARIEQLDVAPGQHVPVEPPRLEFGRPHAHERVRSVAEEIAAITPEPGLGVFEMHDQRVLAGAPPLEQRFTERRRARATHEFASAHCRLTSAMSSRMAGLPRFSRT